MRMELGPQTPLLQASLLLHNRAGRRAAPANLQTQGGIMTMNTRTFSFSLLIVLLMLLLVGPALAGTPGTAKWVLPLGSGPDVALTHPARAKNGTVYVGCSDGNLYAIKADGTIKWVYEGGIQIATTPAVYYSPDGENAQYDGTVYVGFRNGVVLAIDPSGDLKWACEVGDEVTTSFALAADGTIYVGVDNGELAAILPDGRKWWSFPILGHGELSDPAVGADGTIYFGTAGTDTRFYAVDTNGQAKWVRKLTEPVTGPAAIGQDGTIYFGADYAFYALYPDGDTKWRKWEDYVIRSSPAIGHEGAIHYCAGTLIARNPDGSWKWDFWYPGETVTANWNSPAVDSSGLIYFSVREGYLYTVAPGGTFVSRYRIESGGDVASAPIVGSDGILYFTVHNVARALYTGSTGGFNSAWPMCGHDEHRTARLDKYWSMMSELKDLLVFVARADLNQRVKNHLVMRLNSAMQSLEAGHLWPATHQLGAFIHHVQALEGKKIPPEIADVLIRDALQILTLADTCDGHHKPCKWKCRCRCRWTWARKPHRFAPHRCHRPIQVAAPRPRHCTTSKQR